NLGLGTLCCNYSSTTVPKLAGC
ncbi:hypothetical protein BVRB_026530, partial [Beta vulgaris subsp. vulgaris]